MALSLALVTGKPVPVVPSADRAALRDRIAETLAAADGFDIGQLEPHDYVDQADAVLSVLPDPAVARAA